MTAIATEHPDLNQLVHPKERSYYVLSVIAAALGALVITLLTLGLGLLYLLAIAGVIGVVKAYTLARLRTNAIEVGPRQLPLVHDAAQRAATVYGMRHTPPVYVEQSGGTLNAFATRVLSRDYVMVNAEIVELALRRGHDALGFVVAHEMAHVRRRHMRKHFWLLPAGWVPFLGPAYSRAAEHTCDAFAAQVYPDGAVDGLAALALGIELRESVDVGEWLAQDTRTQGFWAWLVEVLASHPRLPRRVRHVQQAGASTPTPQPLPI